MNLIRFRKREIFSCHHLQSLPMINGISLFVASALGSVAYSSTMSPAPKQKGSFLLQTPDKISEAANAIATLKGKSSGSKEGGISNNEKLGRELIALREKQMGPNVSIFYKQDGGLVIPEGEGCYMKDVDGNLHLDCCNNVACVGHAHPAVVEAGQKEIARIFTNGRFLNPIQQRYLTKLLATLPEELNTIYLVNSGSEANDLALRIARTHTKKHEVICLDYAYHGHTQATMEISPYKWAQATDGISYKPSTTHVVSCPDSYRGKYRGMKDDTGLKYAEEIRVLMTSEEHGDKIGTFIAESIVGCGGQIVLPPSYLRTAYEVMRSKGAVCIADEVQTGFARAGSNFWTFQEYGVVPDIVTMGKPMGNGFPIAAVVCRRELAESFASTGIEYFNTYGGNSLACAVAEAVFDTIQREELQAHALKMGKYLQDTLKPLIDKYDWVGDVRGMGLFQGVEFVVSNKDTENLQPHPHLTKFVVDFLRYQNVIISRDGPDENVIKIKPPLVFGIKEADILVNAIDNALQAAKDLKLFD